MLIEKSFLKRDQLKNKTILITGGGGGIGYETSRALAWLGANVIIAEIEKEKGSYAEKSINSELNSDRVHFYHMDISDEKQIDDLYLYIKNKFGFLDVIFNNATITPLGAVDTVSIKDWDRSYSVNLRAPVLLCQKFLPDMKKNNRGAIAFVPSSGAAPFMGAYEVFKTSQVELCNTLSGELENTNIITYSIGPGLVKTETAKKGIETVAGLMNISTDEFYRMNESQMLDEETAGTGFAISVVFAEKYSGQEIGSIQALIDGGVFSQSKNEDKKIELDLSETDKLKTALSRIVNTYNEQYQGWLSRNIFERQWVLRDFKKTVGISADEMKSKIEQLNTSLCNNSINEVVNYISDFINLKRYYERQYKLLQSYEKDPEKLKENSGFINSWINDLEIVLGLLKKQ